MAEVETLQPIGDDWFLLDDLYGSDYYSILAGEAGVKSESRVGSNRATSAQPNHTAAVRLHLTHLPLLGGREVVNAHPGGLAAPRLYLQEHNPEWWEELRPYQQQAALWAAARCGCILRHDLGLGKTRTGLAAARPPMLVLCPKSAISVWQDECMYAGLRCETLEGQPPQTFRKVQEFFAERKATTDVWLLNYHVAPLWIRYFCHLGPMQGLHTIICDEAHYLQKRALTWTLAINGIERERCILLTATPMRNKLRSLWSLLNTACPKAFGNEYEFRIEYCGAVEGGYGLEDGGREWRHSDRGQEALERLRLRLGEVMHSLTRAEVGHEVVPLRREALYVDAPADVLSKVLDESAAAAARLRGGAQTIAWYTDLRHRVGMLKVTAAVERTVAELPEWKRAVLWIWHDDVVIELKRQLREALPDVPIDEMLGKTSQKKRDATHRAWRASKSTHIDDVTPRILIASIAAASQAVGFTTAGLAIGVELDWAPLQIQQLEKRTHRFGQIHPSCLMVYCVLRGTIDETMAETLLEKSEECEDVLGEDGQVDQMKVFLGDIDVAEQSTDTEFMQRVAERLLAHKED